MAGKTTYTEEMQQKSEAYLEQYAEYDHAFPSQVGLAYVLKKSRSTIKRWATEKNDDGSLRNPQFADLFERMNQKQQLIAWKKGLTGEYNSNLVKLLLADHGYCEQTKQENTHSGPDGQPIEHKWVVEVIDSAKD